MKTRLGDEKEWWSNIKISQLNVVLVFRLDQSFVKASQEIVEKEELIRDVVLSQL